MVLRDISKEFLMLPWGIVVDKHTRKCVRARVRVRVCACEIYVDDMRQAESVGRTNCKL